MKNRNLKRSIDLTFRVNQEEYALIYKQMAAAGMKSRNAFLVKLIRGSTLYPAMEIAKTNLMFAEAIRQLRGIATNINQLAKIANATGQISVAGDLTAALEDVKKQQSVFLSLWTRLRSMLHGDS